MAQTMISMRVDNDLKQSFDALCKEFGMSSSAAMNMFMKAVVRERRIPFEIKADPSPVTGSYNDMALHMQSPYGIQEQGYIPGIEGIMYDSMAGGGQDNKRRMTVDDISYEAVHAQFKKKKDQK